MFHRDNRAFLLFLCSGLGLCRSFIKTILLPLPNWIKGKRTKYTDYSRINETALMSILIITLKCTKEQIINSGQTDEASLSLLDIMIQAAVKVVSDSLLFTYTMNKGYVFYKTENGENILLEIRKENDRWGIVKS